MRKTTTRETDNRLTVNADTLAAMLDCGKGTAVKIAEASGARVQFGKRVLYKISMIDRYLDTLAEQ